MMYFMWLSNACSDSCIMKQLLVSILANILKAWLDRQIHMDTTGLQLSWFSRLVFMKQMS